MKKTTKNYKRKHLRKVKSRKNKSNMNMNLKGGSPFLASTYTGFPARYAIPINDYSTDVQAAQLSTRLDPPIITKGGSKKRKTRKYIRKMKGGFIPFSMIKNIADPFAGPPNNLLMTTGTESGGLIAYNLITNNSSNNQSAIPVKITDTHLA